MTATVRRMVVQHDMCMTKSELWQISTWATKNTHCTNDVQIPYRGFSQICDFHREGMLIFYHVIAYGVLPCTQYTSHVHYRKQKFNTTWLRVHIISLGYTFLILCCAGPTDYDFLFQGLKVIICLPWAIGDYCIVLESREKKIMS